MVGKSQRVKSLADQIAELEDPTPKDFDPEELSDQQQSSDEDSSGDEADAAAEAGREHYESVGKSKLRKPAPVELGREYAGSKVSRSALNDEESEDDPFRARSGDNGSESSEDDLDEQGGGIELGSGDDSESDEQTEIEEEETDDTGDGSEDDSENDESEEDEEDEDKGVAPDDRAELRRLMATDNKTVAASISQAAKADASKGMAVKQQRLAFDALLNARIKLQKGLTALTTDTSNTEAAPSDGNGELIKSAETAALTLWNNLDDLRHALAEHYDTPASGSKKRKRSAPVTSSTRSIDIWNQMKAVESQSLAHRRAVLDKWSRKARGSKTLPNSRGKLLNTKSDSITTVLDAYVATENGDIASKRARTTEHNPSSKVAAMVNGSNNKATLYDDAPFYQSLLRDLVEQRMSSSNNGAVDAIASQLPSSLSINPTTGLRKDKIKRAVDTKASKGRKMKYTVQEKLQNFMAPEDRGAWSNRAREEFFASLLGRSVGKVLGEDEDSDLENGGVDEDEDDIEEGGLKLFRS